MVNPPLRLPGVSPGDLNEQPGLLKSIVFREFLISGIAERMVTEADLFAWKPQPSELRARKIWIDFAGVPSTRLLLHLQEQLGWSELAVEDVQHVQTVRTKIEAYDSYQFFVFRLPSHPGVMEQDDIVQGFVSEGLLVTFRQEHTVMLDPVINRLRNPRKRTLKRPMSHFAYVLLDLWIDHYFPLLSRLAEQVDDVESESLENEGVPVKQLHRIRKQAARIEQYLRSHRAVCSAMMAKENVAFNAETRLYLRDCLDHIEQQVETAHSIAGTCGFLLELSLSASNQRTNEVVKALTLVSFIFVPLSFLVGLYGMNFNTSLPGNMPELNAPYGYFILLAIMLLFAFSVVFFFRRKRWL